ATAAPTAPAGRGAGHAGHRAGPGRRASRRRAAAVPVPDGSRAPGPGERRRRRRHRWCRRRRRGGPQARGRPRARRRWPAARTRAVPPGVRGACPHRGSPDRARSSTVAPRSTGHRVASQPSSISQRLRTTAPGDSSTTQATGRGRGVESNGAGPRSVDRVPAGRRWSAVGADDRRGGETGAMRPPASQHLRGLVLAASGALCLVPDSTLIRLVDADDSQIIFFRPLFVGIALALLTMGRHRGGAWRAYGAIGARGRIVALAWAVSLVLFPVSVNHTAVANTLVILATAPFFAALATRLLLGERIGGRT